MPSLKLAGRLIQWRSAVCSQSISLASISGSSWQAHMIYFLCCSLYVIKLPLTLLSEKTLRDVFLKCCTLAFSQISLFFSPRTSPPAAKTCQAGASQSKGVRGHQLESHPRPREPAAQLATGSGMSDFLHGVTAVCGEVTATSQYAVPFSVWRGRPHLNSKEPSQCHQ